MKSRPGLPVPHASAWSGSRKPLVGEFTFQGKNVFLIANHFTSKGGDQSERLELSALS
ncbi:hypothetical protein [Streptomyces acidicola]|uniref:hypothetical protein n=1 Tax=Streptomyces acidicola TaxID=2596892 RepID=UPI00382000F2